MIKHSVYFDCDPGVDDCIALMAALGSPEEIDLKGVGVVAGNVPAVTGARNAAAVMALANRADVRVHAGCPRPLLVAPEYAEHIHGETGLGDAVLPMGRAVDDGHAIDVLCELLYASEPESITLVITGPMTNLAVALVRSPQITMAIKEIVVMGGAAIAGGNITPYAEFNIYADPHAAHIVLDCGRPITMIGLDATLQLRCTATRMARLRASHHPATVAACAMIAHVNRVYSEVYGSDGAALHDPCTIGYLLAPTLFCTRPARVAVDTSAGPLRGQTAAQFDLADPSVANVNWVTALEADTLFDLLFERIERL